MSDRFIELVEYSPASFKRDLIEEEIGEIICNQYSGQINIEFPSPKTQHEWRLTSLGWVGIIKVKDNFTMYMQPKIPIKSFFTMLEFAYQLKSFHILEGLVGTETIMDFYNQLAYILANRVLIRSRRGFYKTYEKRNNSLPYVCEMILVNELIKKPLSVNIPCEYHENTATRIIRYSYGLYI